MEAVRYNLLFCWSSNLHRYSFLLRVTFSCPAYLLQNTSSFSFSSSNGSASEHHNQSTGGSRSQGAPPPFGSMPFNTGSGTADFANMFMNMAANAYQGQHSQDSQGDHHSSNGNGDDEPEIRVDGNVNVDFGEMPAELSGALRSVMQMLSGVASNGNAHDTPNEGPTRPN